MNCKHMYICEFCTEFQDKRCQLCCEPINRMVKIYRNININEKKNIKRLN